MMDATLRIKNLSIALERLHRLSGSGWGALLGEVENLLQEEVQKFREEKEKENQWPRRPAKPPTDYNPFNPSSI